MSKERSRVSVGNRLAIKSMWEDGAYTVKDIGKTLRLPEPTVYSIIQRNGWEKGSSRSRIIAEHEQELQEAFDQAEAEKERIKQERIDRWDMQHHALFQMVTNAQIKIHTKFQKSEKSLAAQTDDIKALNLLANTLRMTQQAARDLFGEELQGEEDLPELLVSEMSHDDIEEVRSEQEKRFAATRTTEQGSD